MQLLQTQAKEGKKDAGQKDHTREEGDGAEGAYSKDKQRNSMGLPRLFGPVFKKL